MTHNQQVIHRGVFLCQRLSWGASRGHKDRCLWVFGWAILKHKASQKGVPSACRTQQVPRASQTAISLAEEQLRQAEEVNKGLG